MATLTVYLDGEVLVEVKVPEQLTPLVRAVAPLLGAFDGGATVTECPLVSVPPLAEEIGGGAASVLVRKACSCDPSKAGATVDPAAAFDPRRHCYQCGGVKPVGL